MASLDTYLGQTHHTVQTALDNPEISARLAEKTMYEPAELEGGLALWDTMNTAVGDTQQKRADQKAATDTLLPLLKTLNESLRDLAYVVNTYLGKDHPARTALGLDKRIPTGQEALLAYAAHVFNAGQTLADPEAAATLTKTKWDVERMAAELVQTQAVAAANQAQENAKGETARAYDLQFQAIDAFHTWLLPLVKDCRRRALKDRPDLLQAMGLDKKTPRKPGRS